MELNHKGTKNFTHGCAQKNKAFNPQPSATNQLSSSVARRWNLVLYWAITMKFIRTPIASIGLAFALCLSFNLTQAQRATDQQAVPQNADTSRPNPPAVRSWSGDPRVQSRTYVFTNTGETDRKSTRLNSSHLG